MRLEFDNRVPRAEQLLRTAAAKQPGRKHQKRKGVRAKQRELQKKKHQSALRAKARGEFSARVAAYWRGESDINPMA